MKLDVLAFGAHPDDVELSCSGTLHKLVKQGKKVGIVDLTRGEMGTRGSAEDRDNEAEAAAKILGVDVRENLDLGDAWFTIDQENILKVITMIRKYQPSIILMNALDDRHIDHGKGAELVKQASFLSGLSKIETTLDGVVQERWRAKHQFNYIQFRYMEPDLVVDITEEFEVKMKAIKAFKTQFYDPNSKEQSTLIAKPEFIDYVEARAREFGAAITTKYGEGFVSATPVPVDMQDLL